MSVFPILPHPIGGSTLPLAFNILPAFSTLPLARSGIDADAGGAWHDTKLDVPTGGTQSAPHAMAALAEAPADA